MTNIEQGSLFPTPDQQPPVDVAAMAEHIAANARPVEYEDRTSEAARDQGHGAIVVAENAQVEPVIAEAAAVVGDVEVREEALSTAREALARAGAKGGEIPNSYKGATPRYINSRNNIGRR